MAYTFDEAVEELKELSRKGADTWYGDTFDKHTNVKGHIEAGDIEVIIYKLCEEYAPTVEMTNEQVDELKKRTKLVSDEFDEDEIPSNVKMTDKLFDPGDNFILLRNMIAIIHPETIKVIEEKSNEDN